MMNTSILRKPHLRRPLVALLTLGTTIEVIGIALKHRD